jgi:orotidine-5'-phosphate decarboxylase
VVNPLLIALDLPDSEQAMRLARSLAPAVGGFKVGLELIASSGPEVVSAVATLGLPVFADVKLHDIPNTVKGAAKGIGERGARWITAHASGGAEMLAAATEGMAEGGGDAVGVLAVTVLTSLDDADLADLGIERTVEEQVAALAGIAASAGVEGVVCAPSEAALVESLYPELLIVTPGIRLGGERHDQKRVATPSEALRAGADYIVVGRAVTRAGDPVAAAQGVLESLTFSD